MESAPTVQREQERRGGSVVGLCVNGQDKSDDTNDEKWEVRWGRVGKGVTGKEIFSLYHPIYAIEMED